MELVFQVEFLSDIVLPSSSNTEGNIQNLDFIAGSKFLGMVAQNYDNFDNSFDVFHSGKVKFGDATLLKDAKQTYKMPLSFFYDKGKEDKFYNHHLIKDFKQFDQLKQLRNSYITKDLQKVNIDYNYSQKSAYNKEHRRSKEGSMFGYFAMKKGLKWQFSIKINESVSNKDRELIKKSIIGKKRLGKSKSAQYGLVKILLQGSKENIEEKTQAKTTLYANSRIALLDECGNPTYDLKYLFDGADVDYAKTQIRTSTFTPYNGVMQTKTYERVVINKGSVIVLKSITPEQLEEIKNGVGIYLAEGFGDVLINPSFLSDYDFSFIDNKPIDNITQNIVIKSDLAKFLEQREKNKIEKLNILNDVDNFIKEYYKPLYEKIKPSQWGKIRSICTSGKDDFTEEIKEYISTGTKKWEENQINTLLKDEYSLEFIKLLSIQMPKQGVKNGK